MKANHEAADTENWIPLPCLLQAFLCFPARGSFFSPCVSLRASMTPDTTMELSGPRFVFVPASLGCGYLAYPSHAGAGSHHPSDLVQVEPTPHRGHRFPHSDISSVC